MPRDQYLEPRISGSSAPVEPSPDELAIRRAAIELTGEHWKELSVRLAHWLGQAYRHDDSLPGEVALTMMRRYGKGHGRVVRHLRAHPASSAAETKQILFGEAKSVLREVVSGVVKYRAQCQLHVELRDDVPASADVDRLAGVGAIAGPDRLDPARIDRFVRDVDVLLTIGEDVWGLLCDDRLLDPAEWTADQKWTAIGMMWGFSVEQIAVIRAVKVRSGRMASPEATRKMMSLVRRKGRALLETMPYDQRRRHDLPGRER